MKVEIKCDLCRATVKYGAPDYRGTRLPHYDLFLCQTCYDQNGEGILRNHEERFIEHLDSKQISLPSRNERGLFPRD